MSLNISTGTCSNLRRPWITCFILSNSCHFSQLVLSIHPVLLYQLLSSSHPLLSSHLYVIYVPYKCTSTPHQTAQFSLPSYRAHILCVNTRFQLNRRLWPSCHSDVGWSRHNWEVYPRTNSYVINPICSHYSPKRTSVHGVERSSEIHKAHNCGQLEAPTLF